ncbi:MAG: flavodoxin family protein [Clostridium sp.]|nr:flavodoxin family protein [Clostridium sp.]
MKIVVITGSAHKNGTTAILADEFIRGAKEAGHEVFRFDSAFKNVHPCIACEKCHNTDKGCVFQDDMREINPYLLEANGIVFISPIYYYDVNAQIKAVIDRFYANDAALHGNKKTALMVTMADNTEKTALGAVESFKGTADFLEWEIAGTVIGVDCGDVDALNKTDYPQQAYNLGKSF